MQSDVISSTLQFHRLNVKFYVRTCLLSMHENWTYYLRVHTEKLLYEVKEIIADWGKEILFRDAEFLTDNVESLILFNHLLVGM